MSSIRDGRPASTVIVGAGVTGLSIAFALATRGASVVVLDRAGIGSGASSVQPGGVRQQWGSRVNCLLSRESYLFYRDVSDRLELRVPARLDSGGYAFVALLAETLERLERNRSLQNELDIPSVSLTPAEAAELVPGLDPSSLLGAVYCAEDGYFDRPLAVVHGFAEAAVRLGATVEEADVAAVEPDGSGWAVVERNGRRRLCDQVVVSAGYDSPAILAGLGVEIPIRKEARHLFYSSPIRQRLLEPLVVSPDQHFAAKQLADGCVLASDLSAEGDASEELAAWHQRVRTSIRTLLPILEFVEFPVHVEGYYDLTPDSQPILGSVPDRPGVWIAAGMSGRGFMIAPAVGRLLADAIEGAAQDDLLDALSLRRFQRQNLHSEPQVV